MKNFGHFQLVILVFILLFLFSVTSVISSKFPHSEAVIYKGKKIRLPSSPTQH